MKKKKNIILELGESTGIYLIDDFLSPQECNTLISYAKKQGLRRQNVFKESFSKSNQSKILRASFISDAFNHDATPTLKKISLRIEDLTCFPMSHGEKLKIICYEKGGVYSSHNVNTP